MNKLSKIQLIALLVISCLLGMSVIANAKRFPTTPPVETGKPVVSGPKRPEFPISSPTKPNFPQTPLTPPGLLK